MIIKSLFFKINIADKKKVFLLIFLIGFLHGFSQTRLTDVQTDKIAYKKVKEFLQNQIDNNVVTFDQVKPSLTPDSGTHGFHVIDREYLIKDSVQKVWNYYLDNGLQNLWNSKREHFGFAYSKNTDSIYYSGNSLHDLIPGLIVYLDINLLFGIEDLAMAFEVTKVDSVQKLVEFSYIEWNGTEGKQQMFFQSTPKGHTLITHISYYKSKPKPREGIYPHVHAQLINKYHWRMKRLYKRQAGI